MQIPTDILQKCWFLAGPTACGKSALSLALAEKIDAEIVSLDSMAIYRGMDIGTAKPSPAEQQRIPHHLIDIRHPHETFSLAEYLQLAEQTCRQIFDSGRKPLFVGGTALYLRGLLRGVFDGPEADWELRDQLEQEAAGQSADYLHQKLQVCDPASASQLHPNDHRRIVRAIEVFEMTGTPLSQQQQQRALPEELRPQHVYWISPPRGWLHSRINQRVVEMFEAGLVNEVRGLLQLPQPICHTARQALGYKEVIDLIVAEREPKEALETIQTRTRQFARRQHTWFRNLEECRALEIDGEETSAELLRKILDDAN